MDQWQIFRYKHNAGKQQLLADYAITKLQSGCWPKGSLFMNVGYKCQWMHIKANQLHPEVLKFQIVHRKMEGIGLSVFNRVEAIFIG